MNKLELNNLGVQELNTSEMSKIEGGGFLNSLLGFVVTPVTNAVDAISTDAFPFLAKTVTNVLNLVRNL